MFQLVCLVAILLPIACHAQGQSLQQLFASSQNAAETQTFRTPPVWYDRAGNFPVPTQYQLTTDPRFNAQVSDQIATNVLTLAHDIGKVVLSESTAKSEVFSPLSIYGALSLLLLGANAQTHDELTALMRLNGNAFLQQNPWKFHEELGLMLDDVTRYEANPSHPRRPSNWRVNRGPSSTTGSSPSYRVEPYSDYRINVANGLFVQSGFSLRPDFRSAVLGVYRSNIQSMDFAHNLPAAVQYINNWVSEKTQGKIPEIVNNLLSPETRLVLASALYFNAMWEKMFIEGATGPKDFFPDGLHNPPITVDMMANGGRFPFYDAKEFDCRIVGLPYKQNQTTMYVILPNNSDRTRLRQMQDYLTADKIEAMIERMEWTTAIVLFPKMHITNELNLKKLFMKMGLNALFEPTLADLSLISNGLGAEPELPVGHAFAPPPQLGAAFVPGDYVAAFTEDEFDAPLIFTRLGEDDDDADTKGAAHNHTTSTSTAATTTEETPTTTTSRSNTTSETEASRKRRSVTYKVPSEANTDDSPLRLKDYIISKRITKPNPSGKKKRSKRQIDLSQSLKQIDELRSQLRGYRSQNPGLFVDEIVHKVDLTVNEMGTEGGAATVTTLSRSGTDVVMRVETPFLFLIRHDETKLPLFYGSVYEP